MENIKSKLIIIDCDGVLYDPTELDVNAMCYAFNDVCDGFGLQDEKFTSMEDCTYDKPVKGFCNYIEFVAKKIGLTTDEFILKMVEYVDYSHLKLDESGILAKLKELNQRYNICICSNNHRAHLNNVLKAKFNVVSGQLPFEVFDIYDTLYNGAYCSKQSPSFIAKLEKHFGVKSSDFLWIDDSPNILDKIKDFGGKVILITKYRSLIDVLHEL